MIVVAMGVCGCGKSSVGRMVAARLGWDFIEGDDLHPEANRAKMTAGTPLTDADRWPWLDRIAAEAAALDQAGKSAVVTCSALRKAYRDRLRQAGDNLRFVHLSGDGALIRQRMESRKGHFMPPGLLESQLRTLEPPLPEEAALVLDISAGVPEIAEEIIASLGNARAQPAKSI